MNERSRPQLTFLSNRKYHCTDIPALHEWLEHHNYHYYGSFDPSEYGRFSQQEAQYQDNHWAYIHSYIQVKSNGEVYTPDPHAIQLLDSLLHDTDQQRTV